MLERTINRRQLLTGFAGAGLYAALSPICRAFQAHHAAPARSVTPEEALQRLIAGNARFVSGKAGHPRQDSARRTELIVGQHPFATILGCSDSRIPPELIFDQGLGDLFVVRVAGNVVDADVAGSVEYSVVHRQSPLVLVLGHTNCGAVGAALLPPAERAKETPDIQAILKQIDPVLSGIDHHASPEKQQDAVIEANVRQSAKLLAALPSLSSEVAAKHLRIVSGIYQFGSGKVNWLT